MKFRAVLVEDEEHSLSRLRRLLSGFPQDIEVVGEAVDGPSAVAEIRAHVPDIVFLDIALPGLNGFQVLEELGGLETQPTVIFTTAHDDHAIKAFETNAIAYLLKPIDADAVSKALAKLRNLSKQAITDRIPIDVLRKLLETAPQPYLERLQCKERDRTVVVKLGEVLYFQADRGCTAVHTANREYLVDTPLVDLERKINPNDFTRIHRSTLVNISWIGEIRRSYDGKLTVRLNDAKGTELAVSRMYAQNVGNI